MLLLLHSVVYLAALCYYSNSSSSYRNPKLVSQWLYDVILRGTSAHTAKWYQYNNDHASFVLSCILWTFELLLLSIRTFDSLYYRTYTHIYIDVIPSINICSRTRDKRESKCDFAKNKFVWTLAPNPLHWVQRVVSRRIMENCLEYCVINVHVRLTTNATRIQSKCRRHRAFKRGGGIYIHTHLRQSLNVL